MIQALSRPFAALLVALAMLASLGCVDQLGAGDTSGTAVYVYDNASRTVKVWSDAGALFVAATPATSAATPSPSRTLSGSIISNVETLGWGGMAVDKYTNKLYLVSATGGKVTRVERVSSQNGALTLTSEVVSFTLGSSGDRFSGGSFGQASVLAGSGILYVTETSLDKSEARVWMIPNAATLANQAVVAKEGAIVLNPFSADKGSAGVAAGQNGMIYAYFPDGPTYTDPGNTVFDGARIRSGQGLLGPSQIMGSTTQLDDATTTYGSLAFDSNSNVVYVARQASSAALPAVMVFTNAQLLGLILNPAPIRTLGETASELPYLRFITHAGSKDWLAGADMVLDKGTSHFYLWKNPSLGGKAVTVQLGGTIEVGGLALASS